MKNRSIGKHSSLNFKLQSVRSILGEMLTHSQEQTMCDTQLKQLQVFHL